jgi:hypothetical protein
MTSKRYTILGWVVWQLSKWVARRKLAQQRTKLGAAGVIALVAAGGILAAKAGDD